MFFRIVADNIDLEVSARIETKIRGNKSLHWTHQFAVLDRALPMIENKEVKQKMQLIDLLPDSQVQQKLIYRMAVLVSRVVTKYLKSFKPFKNVVLYHIPHTYTKEMSSKSESVSRLQRHKSTFLK